ncbi:MAG: 5-bromo-4-chloroindolyl phosphate hydrolysis family protein [Pseudomonadota bacterium]
MASDERESASSSGAEPPAAPLRQAEVFGGPASGGKRETDPYADPGAQGIKTAVIAGVSMLAATALAGVIGAPSWLAFVIGLAVFVVVAIRLRPSFAKAAGIGGALGGGVAAPLQVDRAAAKAAGLDPAAADARLTEAAARLGRIEAQARQLNDPPLLERIRAMTAEIRLTLEALAADPSDIDMARKFLITTIPSAEASMERYAALGVRDAALSERFAALMDEVAEAAQRQRAALRRDDALALEVEMEVLAERLRQS